MRVEKLAADGVVGSRGGGGFGGGGSEVEFEMFNEHGGMMLAEAGVESEDGAYASVGSAAAARDMYEDICAFFGREEGGVAAAAWSRYMRYRARSHADAAANFVVAGPSNARSPPHPPRFERPRVLN